MSDKQLPNDATRTTPTTKATANGNGSAKGGTQPRAGTQPTGSQAKGTAAKGSPAKGASTPAGGAKTAPATGAKASATAAKTTQPAGTRTPATGTTSAAPAAGAKAAAVAQNAKAAANGAPMIEVAEEPERSWLSQKMLLFGGSAFSTSMIVHIVALLALGLIVSSSEIQQQLNELTASVETPQEMVTQELDQKITPTNELSLTSASPTNIQSGEATGAVTGVSAPSFDNRVAQNSDGPPVKVGDIQVMTRRGANLTTATPDGTLGEPAAVVDNYSQAMDRITQEILLQLSKNKVLLIWCFDQSESMKDDQKEIRDRIEKVYQELGLSSSSQGEALLTAVASYGKETMIHTPKATSDLEKIREAISTVPVDESGEEMMCTAIGTTIQHFRDYATRGQRQMMFVLVSDESGNMQDNLSNLEAAIATAKSARCICYALGREAVFGYPYAYMRWQDPTTKINFWLQIDRGPETPMPEQLQTDGFHRRWDAHASGFGPYEQVRIAQQTGGVFFMLPSVESNLVRVGDRRKYELEMMRPYLPDLSARQDYINERDKHPDRAKIWEVIADLNPWDKQRGKDVVVQVDGFSLEKPKFAQQVAQNQLAAERLIKYLMHNEEELIKIKKLRDREASPRWRANYDIIFAQVIAYRVRLYEYGYYLQKFIENPKPVTNPLGPNRKTTHWQIRTRAKLMLEDKHKADIERATLLLKDVIKDHPGTPYAARAEWELKRGFGVELIEDYHDPRSNGIKRPNL